MKVEFYVRIIHHPHGGMVMFKTIDLPFAPSKGMIVEDSAWHGTKSIENVRFGLQEEEPVLYVDLKPDANDTNPDLGQWVKMYETHDWKRLT